MIKLFSKLKRFLAHYNLFVFFWKDFWLTTIFSVFVENIFGSLKSFQFFLSSYIILIVLLNSVNLSRKKEFPFEVFFNFWKDWNEQKKALLKILCFQEKSWKDWLNDQKMQIFKVWDIVTIIEPRKKTHQTHVSSALKTFYHHLRRLWDNRKNLEFWAFASSF